MLPIGPELPNIIKKIRKNAAVLLEATPGSGKTTMVPLELLKAFAGIILVLEPRRLATKMAAERVASLLGEEIGQTVGYLYRFERKVGPKTRLIFLTEGTFLRYLQSNPKLAGVDVVVLDEFHERHLATDMAWGLLYQLSKNWPTPPRLLIMSATLDEKPLRQFLPELQKIVVTAPVYPLEICYAPKDSEWAKRPLERKALWGIQEAWKNAGDILVFLPGLGEIKRVQETLNERLKADEALVLILHGQESSPEHLVMKPQKIRKIILASNVAESSLTIPGVGVVVDAGLQREAIFDPWSGISELITGPCSKASAIQRAGRAARTGPGVCLRLYSELDYQARAPFTLPEVLKSVLLELAQWDLVPEEFPWPSPPALTAWQSARELLMKLQALEGTHLSSIGLAMAQLPLPPRAARALVAAREQGTPTALKDMIRLLAQWLERGEQAKRLEERLRQNQEARGLEVHVEKLLLTGFADRIAKVRGEDAITASGETWRIGPEVKRAWDARQPWGLVLDVNGIGKFVTKLIPLEEEWLLPLGKWEESSFFDDIRQKMIKRSSLKLGALTLQIKDETLQSGSVTDAKPMEAATRIWLEEFQASIKYERWNLMAKTFYPEKPLANFEWQLFTEEFLLEAKVPDEKTRDEFLLRLNDEIQLYLDASFQKRLKDLLPTHYQLHAKRSCEIIYEAGKPPAIEAFIQDFYGRNDQPSIAEGRISLTVRLCGPHKRPEQITGDLKGFWKNTYAALSRELKRDYPRHYWPEDPTTAEPKLHTNPRPPR